MGNYLSNCERKMNVLTLTFDPGLATVARDGTRVVTINGKEESLNDLAEKIFKIACTDAVDQLTVGQRLDGIRVVRLMKDAYLKTDQKIQNANIFFRAFVWMKEGISTFFLPNMREQIEKETVIRGLLSYEISSGRIYNREESLKLLDPKLTIQAHF